MIVEARSSEVNEWPKVLQLVFPELSPIAFLKIEVLFYELATDFERNAFGPLKKIGLEQKVFPVGLAQFVEPDKIERAFRCLFVWPEVNFFERVPPFLAKVGVVAERR